MQESRKPTGKPSGRQTTARSSAARSGTQKQTAAAHRTPAGKQTRRAPQRTGQAVKPKPQARGLSAGERRGAQMLLAILFVAVAVYLVLLVSIALFVWYSFSVTPKSETLYSLHLYQGDGDDVTRVSTYSVQQANNSYGLYLRYSDLAPLCGFGIAGDTEQITLFLPSEASDGAGSVVCSRNSSLVQINGTTVRLSSPILFEGTDYLLPVSLFEGYLRGLQIEYDAEKNICRVTVPNTPAFSLKLHRPETAAPCDVTGLPDPSASNSEPSTSS